MPFQYDFKVGKTTMSCLPEKRRVYSLKDAVKKIDGANIVDRYERMPWHPVTVGQGRENLFVDLVVAEVA
ncbi:MAG: hypothetical protein AABX23_02760 [Nanoarchaeota archaeon]